MLELSKENFEEEVLKAEGHVLVDFWRPSCKPCKALMPYIEALEETHGDKIKFASFDITKARRLAIGQKVMGLPTIAMYKDGEKIDAVVAAGATKASVEELVEKYA